jgi:hypothetical protein
VLNQGNDSGLPVHSNSTAFVGVQSVSFRDGAAQLMNQQQVL